MDTYLPPESSYLHKYFRGELPRTFVSYYLAFNELIVTHNIKFFIDNFIDHTGLSCSQQRLRYLLKKLQIILNATKESQLNLDLDMLQKIKLGKYKFE